MAKDNQGGKWPARAIGVGAKGSMGVAGITGMVNWLSSHVKASWWGLLISCVFTAAMLFVIVFVTRQIRKELLQK